MVANRTSRISRRAWALAAVTLTIVVAVVIGGAMTHWYGFAHDPNREESITAREDKVRRNLTVPESAQFNDVSAAKTAMVLDDRDALGPDADRVLAHWGVGGTVESKTANGALGSTRFSCEVYFLPESVVTTFDVVDRNAPGQWTLVVH